MTGPRLTLDADGRAKPARPAKPAARKYVNHTAARILATCYPGQVPAAVIERALTQMAKRDGLAVPKPPTRRTP
ncbi:hypothetical protein [Streptomyces sp. NPDC055243]|uniref:hypothetical protein n=1 Tax=Streptomyces sp. NPDC055243 TaxID=3365720 RepID=UPI0037D262BF